jgi:hypothetical protein
MRDNLTEQQKQGTEEIGRLLREAADDLRAAIKEGEQTRADWRSHQERTKQAIVDAECTLLAAKQDRLRVEVHTSHYDV